MSTSVHRIKRGLGFVKLTPLDLKTLAFFHATGDTVSDDSKTTEPILLHFSSKIDDIILAWNYCVEKLNSL